MINTPNLPATVPALETQPESHRSLSCRVYRSFAELETLRETWDAAVLALGGSVYMTFDWCRIWWQFYGAQKELRVHIFTQAEQIVAIIPLYLEDLGLRPLRLRVARLVGANVPPKVFNPPVDPACSAQVFESLLARLFAQDQCDILSFGPVSGLHQASDTLAQIGQCYSVERGVHSVFWLPKSMDEYYGALSKNERKNRRKYELRLLSKEYQVTTDVIREPVAAAAEFERFVPQHTAQWRQQAKPGHFGAWPSATEFNRALVQSQSKLGRTRFIRILANGEVISSQYAFALGDTYYWELPARTVGNEWERFSLGPTGIVTMIAAAIQEGLARIEGGLAHYDYKLRLNAKEHPTRTFRFISGRSRSRVAARLFNLWRLGLLFGYHKIWYRRIGPRLPQGFSSSQWRVWLRSDF